MSEARVRVSLTEGMIEFEGPEKFVADLVNRFSGVIQTALVGEPPDEAEGADASSDLDEPQPAATSVDAVASPPPSRGDAFNDIFAATETGVQVLRVLPGSNKAVRAVNLAKLYLYGLKALKQRDTAFFAEIAHACRVHGCLDSHNMSASLKAHHASFVFGGRGKRQTVSLSAPGIEETTALIARLRTGGNGIAQRGR
jgi:hypothetical protein